MFVVFFIFVKQEISSRSCNLFPVLRNKSATKFMNTINYKKRRKPRIDCFVKKERDPRFTTIPFKPLTDEK